MLRIPSIADSVLAAFAFAVVFFSVAPQNASAKEDPISFSVLPGESRVITNSLSASRDTALLAYQVLPQAALATGGDFAVFGLKGKGLDLRAGLYGLIEVQSRNPDPGNFLSVPHGPYLWRGLLGYSLSFAPYCLAERLLGEKSNVEATISYRHESEHYTGPYEQAKVEFAGVPHIGNFFMPEVALQKRFGLLELIFRAQAKIFLPKQSYSIGPGGDLIFRLHALTWMHPIFSVFGEYLIGKDNSSDDKMSSIPDNYLLSSILGVLFPGNTADLQILMVGSVGHGKGLLAFEKEARLGWAIRVGLFKNGIH